MKIFNWNFFSWIATYVLLQEKINSRIAKLYYEDLMNKLSTGRLKREL